MGKEIRRALVTSVILAVVLLASVNVPGVVAGSQHTPSIQSATIEGEGVLERGDDHATLWNNGSYELTVSVASGENPYELCTRGIDPDAASCRYVRLENGTQSLTMTAFPWDGSTTGTHALNVTIGSAGSSQVHDYVEREIRLVDPAADPDDDGLDNRAEYATGTNMSLQDTDRDGLDDGAEVHNYGTDPTSIDSDGDGLTDAREINGRTDPTVPDTDGDGLADGPEVNDFGTDPMDVDTDDDGLTDAREAAEFGTDPIDPDTDGDGFDDGQEVDDPAADPTDPEAPEEPIAQEGQGVLPPGVGRIILVLVVVVLVGAGTATGISVARRGRVHAWLESRGDQEKTSPGDGPPPSEDAAHHSAPTTEDEPTDEPPRSPSTPILTDEERVLRMLHDNGGQVRQQRIVTETDWSKSKVSRLLSRMAEDGTITKITLGRENVIKLPEDDDDEAPTHARDPTRRDRS